MEFDHIGNFAFCGNPSGQVAGIGEKRLERFKSRCLLRSGYQLQTHRAFHAATVPQNLGKINDKERRFLSGLNAGASASGMW
jgi:hypothetical protein